MSTVVFDLNRTLYDPEADVLLPGAIDVLHALTEDGHVLHLISRHEPGRNEILDRYGLEPYFSSVRFVDEKSATQFRNVIAGVDRAYVVGDYLHEDIRFGNQAGAKTIWLKRGTFADMRAEVADDRPWATIDGLLEVLELVR